ncbi:hypothetical protein [Microbacterium sp. KNMS]
MTRFPALLDTNDLYGSYLNDVFLTLAERGLFRPLWSETILEELERNLILNGQDADLVERRITTMRTHFPDAIVVGYESLYPGPTVGALTELVADYRRPELSIDDLLVVLARAGVPDFAQAVRPYLD